MHVGCGVSRLFSVTIVLFCISMIPLSFRRKTITRRRRSPTWKIKHAYKSMDRRSDRWKNWTWRIGGTRIDDFLFILLSLLSVS